MSVRQRGIKKVQAPGMLRCKCWLICPGPGFDGIEEVACVDEDVGFFG